MLNLEAFDKSKIPAGKLAAHVLWINEDENVVEVVDTLLPCNIESAFQALKHRVDAYGRNATLADFDIFVIEDPGCNAAIFKVQFIRNAYQLNFVEIV